MFGTANTFRMLFPRLVPLSDRTLRMISNIPYDNTGQVYNHTRILDASGDGIDLDAYHAYSPVYLSYEAFPR